MEKEVLETLRDLREGQQEMVAKQEEALRFLHAEAEKAQRVRDQALAMQKEAVDRARRIGYLAAPAILLCVFLIIYLTVKYRIL